jgi:hypothetical protein
MASGPVSVAQLPIALRSQQVIPFNEGGLSDLYQFLFDRESESQLG